MLRLAASLADRAHVSLGDAITGIDGHNVGLLIKSVRHASGRRQFSGLASRLRGS
jgi:C-terminal processing protease CtpA/Prc